MSEHVWPEISSGHDCSYADCWCDHRECTNCGVEETTPEADAPCPGQDRWVLEAKRLIGLMGCSDEVARDLALGSLASAARTDEKTPKQFYEDLRWLYSNFNNTDRMLRSLEAEANTAIQMIREQRR